MYRSAGQPAEDNLQLGGTGGVVWPAVHVSVGPLQSLRCTLGSNERYEPAGRCVSADFHLQAVYV